MSDDAALEIYQNELDEIREAGLYKAERVISSQQDADIEVEGGKHVINFCANNYLGLANHPEIMEAAKAGVDRYGFGVASVRFICGTQSVHKELEHALSDFHETDDTILYNSCFDANTGLFETILGEEDAVISDELNHASIIDGIRLCSADLYIYEHSDMADLEAQLQASQDAGVRMICTDGVFSMDGDVAKLDEICRLAKTYNAGLVIGTIDEDPDEAIHDVRKRCKKIRAVARLVRDEMGSDAYQRYNTYYRDLARRFSDVRDGHVMVKTLDDVTEESREMLERVFEGLMESQEELGSHLKESLKADKTLGPCPDCGEDLLVRKSRRGSYFVGCDGYPDCDYTLPLPSTGKPLLLDDTCEEHGLNHVKMLAGRKTFVHGCPQCKADEADEEDDLVIGVCPDCGDEHGGELAIKRTRSSAVARSVAPTRAATSR